MRNLLLSALLLASAFQTAFGQTYTSGDFTYTVSNNQATITRYSGVGGAVTIPSSVNGISVVTIGNGYPVFPPYLFYTPNTSVTSLSIPSSVTTISSNVFNSCTSLASVTIPQSVTLIDFNAFYGCTGLTTFTIPNSVTTIGEDAFNGCTGLTTFTIPNSVTTIGQDAFYGCTGLASITIGTSVTSIGSNAFSYCTSLGLAIVNGLYPSINIPVGTFPDSTLVLSLNSLTALATNPAFVTALATNPAFLSALASSIQAANGNYGIATQSGLSSAIEPLATKTQITTAINEGKTSGIASVTASPNTWSLFTTSQIQNMAVGDLVLTRQVGGGFVLNYDIEQSTDLQTWTTYAPLSLPLTGLPTDKAFVRIKVKGAEVEPLPPTNNAGGGGSNSDGPIE